MSHFQDRIKERHGIDFPDSDHTKLRTQLSESINSICLYKYTQPTKGEQGTGFVFAALWQGQIIYPALGTNRFGAPTLITCLPKDTRDNRSIKRELLDIVNRLQYKAKYGINDNEKFERLEYNTVVKNDEDNVLEIYDTNETKIDEIQRDSVDTTNLPLQDNRALLKLKDELSRQPIAVPTYKHPVFSKQYDVLIDVFKALDSTPVDLEQLSAHTGFAVGSIRNGHANPGNAQIQHWKASTGSTIRTKTVADKLMIWVEHNARDITTTEPYRRGWKPDESKPIQKFIGQATSDAPKTGDIDASIEHERMLIARAEARIAELLERKAAMSEVNELDMQIKLLEQKKLMLLKGK